MIIESFSTNLSRGLLYKCAHKDLTHGPTHTAVAPAVAPCRCMQQPFTMPWPQHGGCNLERCTRARQYTRLYMNLCTQACAPVRTSLCTRPYAWPQRCWYTWLRTCSPMPAHMAMHMPAHLAMHMPAHMAMHMPAHMAMHMPAHTAMYMPAHTAMHIPAHLI